MRWLKTRDGTEVLNVEKIEKVYVEEVSYINEPECWFVYADMEGESYPLGKFVDRSDAMIFLESLMFRLTTSYV